MWKCNIPDCELPATNEVQTPSGVYDYCLEHALDSLERTKREHLWDKKENAEHE